MLRIIRCVVVVGFLGTWLLLTPAARAEGGHFFFEPFAGTVFSQDNTNLPTSLETGLTVGFGGKFKGFAPRFFLYARGSFTGVNDANGFGQNAFQYPDTSRLTGGLRLIIPMASEIIRLNLEIGGGHILAEVGDHKTRELDILELGAGLNFRLSAHFSLGIMVQQELAFLSDNTGNSWAVPDSLRLNATFGFHF